MHDLTGFQRDILYVITGLEEPHGLAVKDELDDYYEQEINHGRLYPNLDDLVDKGLLRKANSTNGRTCTRSRNVDYGRSRRDESGRPIS